MDKHLQQIIEEDKAFYYGNTIKHIYRWLTLNPVYRMGRFIIAARKAGYYSEHQNTILGKILYLYWMREKHILGQEVNVVLGPSKFGRRLRIYHGNIVINGGAIIGDDCELHGNNCIGNKGSGQDPFDAPIIGNNVVFGVGAQAIGR